MRTMTRSLILVASLWLASCGDSTPGTVLCGGVECGPNQACVQGVCACPSPFITCGLECVNPATDPEHCGGCGDDCMIGVECISGICQPCSAPSIDCGDECVADLSTSLTSCGSCGNACGPGAACVSGTCTCPDATDVHCGDEIGCVDLSSDPTSCGSCGNSCGVSSTCVSGTCACTDPSLVSCPGIGCVDLSSDDDACGSCGNNCSDGLETCTSGVCVCVAGTQECGFTAYGTDCIDLLSDPRNCGDTCAAAEGNNCSSDERCAGGACVCRPELTDCGGNCVSTSTSLFACGGCGDPCAPGQVCANGACVAACPADTSTCGSETCVDLSRDSRHCGACGDNCSAGEVCVDGNCESYQPTGDCTACPCARCDEAFGGGAACCSYGGEAICVDADTCP